MLSSLWVLENRQNIKSLTVQWGREGVGFIDDRPILFYIGPADQKAKTLEQVEECIPYISIETILKMRETANGTN